MRRQGQDGFTLMEMLIVMVILAMLVALVLPAIGAGMRNWQLRNKAAELLSALRIARTEAVTSKMVQAVRLDLDADRFDRIQASAFAAASGQVESVVRDMVAPLLGEEQSPIDFLEFGDERHPSSGGVHYVYFYPRGNSSGGRLVLKHRDGNRQIILDVAPITGRANIEKNKGSE